MTAPASAPTLLVVHGALGSASQMLPIATALDVVVAAETVELPGHGSTGLHGRPFAMRTFADALLEVAHRVRERTGTSPAVFGHSMGGYLALLVEAEHPGTFARITTLGTKFEWTPESADAVARRLDPDAVADKVPAFAEALDARHRTEGGWRRVMTDTAAMLRALGASPLLTRALLSRIAVPVRIVEGSRDDTLLPGESERAAAMIPGARHVILDDVQHPIERVPPEAIVALVREWTTAG